MATIVRIVSWPGSVSDDGTGVFDGNVTPKTNGFGRMIAQNSGRA